MARFEVKNGHGNTHVTIRLDYFAKKKNQPFGFNCQRNWFQGHVQSLNEDHNLHFDPSYFYVSSMML